MDGLLMPLYKEGDRVALKDESHALEAPAGVVGVIWVRYETQPPCYEVTFTDQGGKPFDMTMCEDELVLANASALDATVRSHDASSRVKVA